jgi:hypothetical protein
VGHKHNKVHSPFDIEAKVQLAKPLLASLKPYGQLGDVERNGQLFEYKAAMVL